MGFFDIFKSPFSVLSELEAKKKELEEKEKREEEEKKKEFREKLGRPSTTGL